MGQPLCTRQCIHWLRLLSHQRHSLGFLLPPMCSSQTPRSQGTTMQSQGTTELVGKGSLLRSPKRQSRGYTRDSGISAHGASAYVGIGIQAAKHVSLEPVKLTATVTTWVASAMRRDRKTLRDPQGD